VVGIRMPDEQRLPPGPRRTLVIALHDLYELAGKPAARHISALIRDRDDLPGTLSHEGVSAVLRGAGGVPRWQNLESLVRVLAEHQRVGEADVEAMIHRIHALWRVADGSSLSRKDGPAVAPVPQNERHLPESHHSDLGSDDVAYGNAQISPGGGNKTVLVPEQPVARWNPQLRTLDILDRQIAIEIVREVGRTGDHQP
jgi:hypothetical protein